MSYLGSARFEKILDKDKFERDLTDTLHKVLQAVEAPPKEKHVRNVIVATYQEDSTFTLWRVLSRFPLQQSPLVCWKMCFVVHRVLRDGPKKAIGTSANKAAFISDLWKKWNQSFEPYAKLVATYLRVLLTKVTFHTKYPEIPGSVNIHEEPFKLPTNADDVFQLSVEIFDLQSSILHLFGGILTHLDPSKGISAQQVQCRIHPLIACIAESTALYDIVFKLMDTMHRSLPADVLEGHRERFNRQFVALRKYYNEARKMKYFERLVEIPELKENPPNFLLMLEQDGLAQEEPKETSTATSTSTSTQQEGAHGIFTDLVPFDMTKEPEPPKKDDRDELIEQLMREGVTLKGQIQSLRSQLQQKQGEMESVESKAGETQLELTEYKEIAEQACNENVLLKREVEELQSQKGAQTAVEARASALDEKYGKLKAVYTKLREEHIELLRTNGEVKKNLAVLMEGEQEYEEKLKSSEEMAQQLSIKLDDSLFQLEEEQGKVRMLTASLETLKSQSEDMKTSSEALRKAADDESKDSIFNSLVCVLECAEKDTRASLEYLVSDEVSGTTCPPEHLVRTSEKTMELFAELIRASEEYSSDTSKVGRVLSTLPSASNSFCSVLSNAKGTQQLISEEDSEKLINSCKKVSDELLAMLNGLKKKEIKEEDITKMGASLRSAMEGLIKTNSSLVPEVEGDMTIAVGEEMSATVQAVEDAVARIQELLQKSRETDKGHKLEVNSSILGACTTLMEAMKTLIKAAMALQEEIVAEGRGSSSTEEFYKKHHRWTEGLVSAAKSVGNGATMVVNSADKVVNGQGKFEELIVYSKDIAASTAQLVAASRVKARARSERLVALKGASKKVTESTGGVVATAQSFLNRRQSESFEYLKNLSLTQAKRAEMECQVRALELEKELESERSRLAELRKLHYHLAGSEEGWEIEEEKS